MSDEYSPKNKIKERTANSSSKGAQFSKKRAYRSAMDVKVSHINNSTINISGMNISSVSTDLPDKDNVVSKSIRQELLRQRSMSQKSEVPVADVSITKRSLNVFLCHSSSDKAVVRKLYQELKDQKWIDPWLDEEKLLPGENWNYEIKKAVGISDVVIVCLSVGSVNKEGYLQREIVWALDVAEEKMEDAIFIIPLKLEKCNVPQRLSKWQWLNYFDESANEKLLRSLKKRAKALNTLS